MGTQSQEERTLGSTISLSKPQERVITLTQEEATRLGVEQLGPLTAKVFTLARLDLHGVNGD
jgi:hypothetical protein